jgi:hypothetical protein
VYSSELSGQPSCGRGRSFIAPKRNLPVGVLENQTCPVSGAGHMWNPSLEPSLDVGHVRCLALTRVRAEEPNMSSTGTGYVQ